MIYFPFRYFAYVLIVPKRVRSRQSDGRWIEVRRLVSVKEFEGRSGRERRRGSGESRAGYVHGETPAGGSWKAQTDYGRPVIATIVIGGYLPDLQAK